MGCTGSKLDELEAVALCKYRSQSLEKAINYRYALAKAHESYIHSLQSVGLSLHRFFLISDPPPPSSSPLLALPTKRKGGPFHPPLQPAPSPSPPPVAAAAASVSKSVPEDAHRHSNSGHLEFHTSDEDDLSDDDDDGSLHSDYHDSPFHHHLETMDGAGTTKSTITTYFDFAKKGAPTSTVTYEQRPLGVENSHVQFGGFDPSSSTASTSYGYYYGDPNMNQNPNYYGSGGGGEGISSYPYAYLPPYAYPQGYGGFFDSSPPVVAAPPAEPSPPSSRAPPPPPSPPQASTWDFLNPFESYQNYQQQSYTPSRSSRELREEEGIPDLEDEEHEVVKEAYGDQKFASGASSSNVNGAHGHSLTKGVVMEEGRRSVGGENAQYHTRGIGTLEREVPLTDKNVGVNEVLQMQSEGGPRKKIIPGSRSVPDAVLEIKAQFDRASFSCEEIGKMLEVGKLPYHSRKNEVVSSKVRYAITPSLSTAATSKYLKKDGLAESSSSIYLNFDEDKGMTAGHLSQTLQKLYIWEKKLLEEVWAEEKMHLFHDRKCKQLKRLNDRGAEPSKIDSTRALLKKLSTKIRIAIQVVNSISNRISKLRDEELWPELHELILGFVSMWRAMTECHRSQFQAVVESSNLNAVAYAFTGNDEHMKATMHLAMELLNWIDILSSWIDAQKSYVKSLNSWLFKCLPNEQEETADGFAPFSPGRLGAPPVFVICNYWSQTIDRISEREVLEAMQYFTSSVMHVWKQHSDPRNHGMVANQAKEKLLKDHEKDDQKFHKAVDAINKRLMQVASQHSLSYTGDIINIDPSTDPNHLHESLQQIFEAMERFSDNSLRAYEELCVRCDEESSRDNERVS